MNRSARYRYNLIDRSNVWADHNVTEIFGFTQSELHQMGNNVLNKLVHPDDRINIEVYHKRLRLLTYDESDQIFCRCYNKHNDTPIFIRFVDHCVEINEKGHCVEIEGEATLMSASEFDARKRLEAGIKNKEFGFHYQPICCLKTGKIVGYEALARWFKPSGIVGPGSFLNLLEGTRLEKYWVAQQIETIVQTLDKLPKDVWLSYNLSRSVVENEDIQWPIIPNNRASRLHVEILETLRIELPIVIPRLKMIRDYGHDLIIDDYGTGNSLSILISNIPIQGIKLDKILTDGIPDNPRLCKLTENLIHFANSEGLITIAEWVRTQQQIEWLVAHNCQYGQGAYYGLPDKLYLE